jgi:hypothetical protein
MGEPMNQDDKNEMLYRLLRGVPEGTFARRELEKMHLEDLDAIEPMIDDLVRREVKRFGEHLFKRVLTPEQCIEIYQRLKAEGRLSPQTIAHHEADKAKGATP